MARIDANWFRFAIGSLTIFAVILNTGCGGAPAA